MMYLAKFESDLADVLIDANDGEHALAALVAHGINEPPRVLRELPPGVACAYVSYERDEEADDDAGDELAPADVSEFGCVLEPTEPFVDFLTGDEKAESLAAVLATTPLETESVES